MKMISSVLLLIIGYSFTAQANPSGPLLVYTSLPTPVAVKGDAESEGVTTEITQCAPSTMGAFSLETDATGKIKSGSIGLIYKNYRKCDLTQDNTRIVTEFGESVLRGECVGSVKLIYDHVHRILFAIEPEKNRKIAISECISFAQDAQPERIVFELSALVQNQKDGVDLEKKATDQLRHDAQLRCLAAGFSGHIIEHSALETNSYFDHFGNLRSASAESVFSCD